jgi:mannose-1-phosphate guanylyltransferase
VIHYAEKPETFVSDVINCGVYVFTTAGIYHLIDKGITASDP